MCPLIHGMRGRPERQRFHPTKDCSPWCVLLPPNSVKRILYEYSTFCTLVQYCMRAFRLQGANDVKNKHNKPTKTSRRTASNNVLLSRIRPTVWSPALYLVLLYHSPRSHHYIRSSRTLKVMSSSDKSKGRVLLPSTILPTR